MFASIGVTTFDRKKLTEFCIKTIHERTPRQEHELIVVDNGSTDGTVEMLKRYKASGIIDKLILNHYNNLGSAINDAWKASDLQAEWLITLSNDSFCMQGWLENFKLIIESELAPDCIFCHMRMPLFETKKILETSNGGFYLDVPIKTFYGAGLTLRKKFVEKYDIWFLEGTRPWSVGNTSGSIYTHVARRLKNVCKKPPVELAKPCILIQDCEFANPEFGDYYRRVYGYQGRGGKRRIYNTVSKFESLKLRGGNTRYPEEYYKGSDYVISEYYKNSLKSQEGQTEWDRLRNLNIKV